MKRPVSDTLRRIANSREHAYKAAGRVSMKKMNACGRIRAIAGYFTTCREENQYRAVLQVEQDLRQVMPPERSRYSKLRGKIENLIQYAHERQSARKTLHGGRKVVQDYSEA